MLPFPPWAELLPSPWGSPAMSPGLLLSRDGGIPTQTHADHRPSVTPLLYRSAATCTPCRFHPPERATDLWRRRPAGLCLRRPAATRVGRKCDRMAVMCRKLVAFPNAALGIAHAGCVQISVTPLYTPRELQHQFRRTGACVMAIDAGSTAPWLRSSGGARCSASRPWSSATERSPTCQAQPTWHQRPCTDSVRRCTPAALACPLVVDDPPFLQCTSSTTGLTQSAMRMHRNLVASVERFRAFMPNVLRPRRAVKLAVQLGISNSTRGNGTWLTNTQPQRGQLRRTLPRSNTRWATP